MQQGHHPRSLVRQILGGKDRVQVVQIGSNDGHSGDPIRPLLIRHPSWKALLVEPVRYVFEHLCRIYGNNPRFKFENIAIAETTGSRPFYYVAAAARQHFPYLPGWFDQLGSFDREHIMRHFDSKLASFIVAENVPTVSLATLLERNGIGSIDLLHIDAEGSDWMILRQLDFARYDPKIVWFEHRHLSESDKAEAQAFLQDRYELFDLGNDYFCQRRRPLPSPTAAPTIAPCSPIKSPNSPSSNPPYPRL